MRPVILVAWLVLVTTTARGAERPRFNDAPLRGLKGYWIQVVLANPALAKKLGVDVNALRSRLEERLKAADLLFVPGANVPRDTPIGAVHADLDLTPPDNDLFGWHLNLEVRDPARLERSPEAGTVMAVTWNATTYGLARGPAVNKAVAAAFDDLVSGLLKAHERGGPATR